MLRKGPIWLVGAKRIVLDRPRFMGILNVTPDSFSDGGRLNTPRDAARAAEQLLRDGADVLDLGAESTRPGAARVGAGEQLRRLLPALKAVRAAIGPASPITIDTTLSAVAGEVLRAGADGINDVSGGTEDPGMLPLIAASDASIILMHRLTTPDRDSYSTEYGDGAPIYDDVVNVVRDFLRRQREQAISLGIDPDRIALDPGLGFGKTVSQNLALIDRTRELLSLGSPIISGISRKSFSTVSTGRPATLPPEERDAASVELAERHWHSGAQIFRVHKVMAHRHMADWRR